MKIRHPAKYTESLLPIFKQYIPDDSSVLDPFAGTGKIKKIIPWAILLEIEHEWAKICGAIVGDATDMPFKSKCFDIICTSPTYGNRMADHFIDHQKEKKYTRNTYTHCLGSPLHKNNSGRMNWGAKYKNLHKKAWVECRRVLTKNGTLILNISNHIRSGLEIDVTSWHISELEKLGFLLKNTHEIKTPRQRFGANSNLRVGHESILVFKKG